jgi:hypothetical protein
MIPFSVFLGEEYLGDGAASWPVSYHYFCRACGTVWCRTLCHEPGEHHTYTGLCPEHDRKPWYPSIIAADDMFRFRVVIWPRAVLVRDFLYLMDRKSAPVISHNLPREAHDQHQAA